MKALWEFNRWMGLGWMKHMVQIHTRGLDVFYVKGGLHVHDVLEKLIESIGQRYCPRQYLAKVNGD